MISTRAQDMCAIATQIGRARPGAVAANGRGTAYRQPRSTALSPHGQRTVIEVLQILRNAGTIVMPEHQCPKMRTSPRSRFPSIQSSGATKTRNRCTGAHLEDLVLVC
jgi:hypothetical protein